MIQAGGIDSIPQMVMRTGIIDAINPRNVRRDIKMQHVQAVTSIPTGAPYGPPGSTSPAMPEASPGPEAPGAGEIKGADAAGRPVREFHVGGNPNAVSAKVAVGALRRSVARPRSCATPVSKPRFRALCQDRSPVWPVGKQ